MRLFLRGECADHKGRTLHEVLSKDDEWLECEHDYIQLLFPTSDRSRYFRSAPTVSLLEAWELSKDEVIIENMRRSYSRMFKFYSDPENIGGWFKRGNHNFLRLSRILKSLRMFGLDNEADELYSFLSEMASRDPNSVSIQTISYWDDNNRRLSE